MPVPSWAAIPDADVDLESPITESLMQRMRNQWAAFMGVDPTAVTQPAFTLPASTQNVVDAGKWTASGSTARTETAENRISVVADDVEDLQLSVLPYLAVQTGVVPVHHYVGHVSTRFTTSGYDNRWLTILAIDVLYTAGSPTGVKLDIVETDDVFSSSVFSYTLPLDNAWHTVRTFNTVVFEGRARATATEVFLTFAADSAAADRPWSIGIGYVRKSFKSKN